MEVMDGNGNVVKNAFADVWILFLSGSEPYELDDDAGSRPINMFNESDLQFLLRGGENSAHRDVPQHLRLKAAAHNRAHRGNGESDIRAE